MKNGNKNSIGIKHRSLYIYRRIESSNDFIDKFIYKVQLDDLETYKQLGPLFQLQDIVPTHHPLIIPVFFHKKLGPDAFFHKNFNVPNYS